MPRLLKWLLGFVAVNVAVNAVLWAAGEAITRSKSSTDLSSGDVELYTVRKRTEHVLRSESRRSAKARVFMGRTIIDLRGAQLSAQGATVDVATVMGRAAVLVRKDWDVQVIEDSRGAEVEVRLDNGAQLGSDTPKVTIRLATVLGSALVGYELPHDSRT